MRFDAPGWLALLALVPVLVVAYLLTRRRRSEQTVPLGVARGVPSRPRSAVGQHLTAAAFLLTVVGVILAMAQPVGVLPTLTRGTATVIVTLDVSNSMDETDIPPSRIEAATASARAFVTDLPDGFAVGLVLFAGTAEIAVAPTPDRAAVLAELADITLRSGTAVGEGVLTSLDAARLAPTEPGATPAPARIVLLSDGASTQGAPVPEAAAAAAAARIPVSTIAFAVTGDIDQIDLPALEELARVSGGRSYTAGSGAELSDVYADIGDTIGGAEQPLVTPVLLATLVAALLTAIGALVGGARRRPAAPAGPSAAARHPAAVR